MKIVFGEMLSKVKDYKDMYRPTCADEVLGISGKTRAAKFLTVSLAAMFLLLPAVAQAAPSWLDSQQISGSSGNSDSPQIAVGGLGNSVAAWEHNDGSKTRIQVATRHAGGSWGLGDGGVSSGYLSTQGYSAKSPSIAMSPTSDAVVVWKTQVATKTVIRASHREASGTWAPAQTISAPNESATEPRVVFDGLGNSYVVWRQYASAFTIPPSPGKIRAATMSKSNGVWSWSSPVTLETAVVSDPRVAVDFMGNAVAIWRRASYNNEGTEASAIIRSAAKPAYKPWDAAVTVPPYGSDDADYSSHQLAVSTTGKTRVVWSDGGKIYSSAKEEVKSNWGVVRVISVGPGPSKSPRVSLDEHGKTVASWLRLPSGGKKIVRAAVKSTGNGNWNLPVTLSDPGQWADQVSAIVSGSGVPNVAWRQSDGSSSGIEVTRKKSDGSWLESERISDEGVNASSPKVSTDYYGNVVAVWRQKGSSNVQVVQSAALDAHGPEKLNLDVPETGVVGEAVEFSAKPMDVWSPILMVSWAPGDGTIEAGQNASHIYEQAGTYIVTATAYDAVLNMSTQTRKIKIAPKQNPNGDEGAEGSGGGGPAGPVSGAENGANAEPSIQPNTKGSEYQIVADLRDVLGIAGVQNLNGGDFKNSCNFQITSPRVGKAKYKTVKIAKKKKSKNSAYTLRLSSRKMKRIVSGHGVKGTMRPGMVKGNKVVCRNVRMALLQKRGKHFSPPGLASKRYKISSRRFKSKSFAKRVVTRLKKRFRIGKLRTKTEADGTLRISFKNYAAKSKQRLSRKANRNIRKKGLRGNTYYLKYSVDISGVTVTKQLKLKATH